MAVQSELGCDSCDLPLAIRLHDTTRHNRVGTTGNRLMQHVVELAEFVATEAETGRILALNPKLRTTEVSRQPCHWFERGWELRQPQAREGGKPFTQCAASSAHCLQMVSGRPQACKCLGRFCSA